MYSYCSYSNQPSFVDAIREENGDRQISLFKDSSDGSTFQVFQNRCGRTVSYVMRKPSNGFFYALKSTFVGNLVPCQQVAKGSKIPEFQIPQMWDIRPNGAKIAETSIPGAEFHVTTPPASIIKAKIYRTSGGGTAQVSIDGTEQTLSFDTTFYSCGGVVPAEGIYLHTIAAGLCCIPHSVSGVKNIDGSVLGKAVLVNSIGDAAPGSAYSLSGTKYFTVCSNAFTGCGICQVNMVSMPDPTSYGCSFVPPEDFEPTLPATFVRDACGKMQHDFDFSQFKTGSTVTVNISTGNDTCQTCVRVGSGATPFKTICQAMDYAIVNSGDFVIQTEDEYIGRFSGLKNKKTISGKRISLVGTCSYRPSTITTGDGRCSSLYGDLTWTRIPSTCTWKASRSNVYSVFNLWNRDYDGLPVPVQMTSSEQQCISCSGTWFTDSTNYVWLNTGCQTSPPSKYEYMIGLAGPVMDVVLSNGGEFYVENMMLLSGNSSGGANIQGTCGSPQGKFVANKCLFAGGNLRVTGTSIGNAISIVDLKDAWLFDCISAYSARDGFNYHFPAISSSLRRTCLVMEYNCKSRDHGKNDWVNKNNNATTVHEGVSVLRIGCYGRNTTGPVLADVNGCYSICIDCDMACSEIGTNLEAQTSFWFGNDAGKTIMLAYDDTFNASTGAPFADTIQSFQVLDIPAMFSGDRASPYCGIWDMGMNSNKEFAFGIVDPSVVYCGAMSQKSRWVPSHGDASELFSTAPRLWLDGNEIGLSDLAIGDMVFASCSIEILQNIKGYNPGSTVESERLLGDVASCSPLVEIWLKTKFSSDGTVEFRGDMLALKDIRIAQGYSLMFPFPSRTGQVLLSSVGGSYPADQKCSSSVSSGLTSGEAGCAVSYVCVAQEAPQIVSAIEYLNPGETLRPLALDRGSAFVTHYAGYAGTGGGMIYPQKFYDGVFTYATIQAGEGYSWGGKYIVAEVDDPSTIFIP